MTKRLSSIFFLILLLSITSAAQSTTIPSPKSVLGFTPGDDRTVAGWSQITDYFERLDRASDRVLVQTLGQSTLKRPLIVAFISARENILALPKYKEIQQQLADPRKVTSDIQRDQLLANGKVFITAEPGGTPDGFRLDVDGNLWCGWGMGNEKQDGVKVFDPTAKPIGFIALPERCANVCFGGVKRNRLFMAASHSLYSLYVNTQGAPGG